MVSKEEEAVNLRSIRQWGVTMEMDGEGGEQWYNYSTHVEFPIINKVF